MTTNDCLKELHAALVAKVKDRAAVDGNNKLALEISGKVAEYGAAWATAFGNDGKLDAEEERDLNARFNALVDTYLPARDGLLVEKAWNGFSVCFVTVFKGIKSYLNDWFGLGLKSLALVALLAVCGCKAFYENAGSHTKVGSLTAPIEVSDGSDSITVKALYSMDGADVYTAKDSLVKIRYSNAYTNDYFAIVKTQGKQDLEVEIEPLASEPTIDEPTTSATSARQPEPTEPTQEAQEGDKDVK